MGGRVGAILKSMKRLGEILLDRGTLAVAELHTGLEACHRSGGRLGTQLLKFGYVEEHQLLDALSEQYGVKSVSAAVLRRAPVEVLSLIPTIHARRLQAVAFQKNDRKLRVAMTNPRDLVGIEELIEITGLQIQPFVATESGVTEAIDLLDGEAENDAAEGTIEASASEWDGMWHPPRITPAQLLTSRRSAPSRPPRSVKVATFPGLAPVEDRRQLEAEQELDEKTYREQLAEAQHRDVIGRLVLRYAAGFFGRLCLFAVHRGAVVGWMARGHGVVLDDVQSFSIPIETETLFHEFRYGSGYHLGPIPDDPDNEPLVRMLGDPSPLGVLLLPIRIKDRAVAFVLGDNPNEEMVAVPVDEVAAAVGAAGIALEVLILKKKITG